MTEYHPTTGKEVKPEVLPVFTKKQLYRNPTRTPELNCSKRQFFQIAFGTATNSLLLCQAHANTSRGMQG